MKNFLYGIMLAIFILAANSSLAQLITPAASPKAVLTQNVGVSEIVVTWSRPAVKGRKVWGGLVPYNEIWRTGANANTTIKFSDAVTISGKEIPAATYGFHTIPGEKEWTLILSKDNNLSGSFGYKQENDALRLTAVPMATTEHTERLAFDVEELTDSTAEISFRWEKLKVSFTVKFKTRDLILSKVNQNFSSGTPLAYATYMLNNGMNLSEALNWVDKSIGVQESYWNVRIKARILEKMGKKSDAITMMEKAIKMGEAMKSAPFDFEDMKKLLADWKK
jgi:hypothetical protein